MRMMVFGAAFGATLLSATAALAQPATDWRTILRDLYRIDIAFDACRGIAPPAAQLLRLEAAIAYVEDKTALEEDELDDLYSDIEAEADKLDEFCKRMADAAARVEKIPQEYR